MNWLQNQCPGCSIADGVIALFISSAAQLLKYGAAWLCCPNKLNHHICSDTTKIVALIACSGQCQNDETEIGAKCSHI